MTVSHNTRVKRAVKAFRKKLPDSYEISFTVSEIVDAFKAGISAYDDSVHPRCHVCKSEEHTDCSD